MQQGRRFTAAMYSAAAFPSLDALYARFLSLTGFRRDRDCSPVLRRSGERFTWTPCT